MFSGAQQNQHHATVQPTNGANQRKIQKALSLLQLLSGVVIGLFIAGIVVPSFLRSGMATNSDLAVGSLRTLTIGGVTFTYTLQNLGLAMLGGLCGSLIALAIEFPAPVARPVRNLLMFLHVDWKGLPRQSGPPSTVGHRKLAYSFSRNLSVQMACQSRQTLMNFLGRTKAR